MLANRSEAKAPSTPLNGNMHIVQAIRDLELASGGPSRSIPQLVEAIQTASRERGWIQHLIYSDRGAANAELMSTQHLRVRPVTHTTKLANQLASVVSEIHQQDAISLIHVHGLWSPTLHRVMRWARSAKIPYIVSPRGMLSEWCFNHKRMKKRIGWWLYQSRDLQRAACLHATSEEERNDIQRMNIGTPVAVIPNGMDVKGSNRELATHSPRLALCITRLHPVKGLDLLIDAWARLRPTDWKLVIAGPSEQGMRERIQGQIARLQLESCIELREEVNGSMKAELLQAAEVFVLPSLSENFGMAIAESLAHGIPVLTTTGTPWSQIVSHQCGWYVAPETAALTTALQQATTSTSETLHEMGVRGRALIANDYSWPAIANRMIEAYTSVARGSHFYSNR